MPGIVGVVGRDPVKQKAFALQHIIRSMMYEPFYTSGSSVHETLGLCVGWVNRAGSFSDCMPLWNKSGNVCLIFFGEHFPDSGDLSRNGRGNFTDARFLMDLVEEKGTDFPRLLNGWFSGILIDLRKEEALLFNDRYGMQRLYCHDAAHGFYFSTEAKALLAIRPELRELDMQSLGELFSFGCVLENRTLFSGISLLPPGSAWTIKKGAVAKKEFYFTPSEWEAAPSLPKEEFYNKLRETFVRLLPKYCNTRNSIAISLTGGLDTRMILANTPIPPGRMPCYTFGGVYRDCFDVKIARKVAAVCNQPHSVLAVSNDFFSGFPELAEKTVFITDGNLDVTGAADLYANRKAREIAPVRLTGNYGSEILRGSRHLKAQPARPGLFDNGFETSIDAAARTLAGQYRGHRILFAAFKQAPWHHYNRLALEQSQLTLRSPYLDNALVRLMFQAPPDVLNSNELSFRLINDGNPALGRIMTDRGLGGNMPYPFSQAAHLYREFLFKADYAFNYGMPPWLSVLDRHLLAPLHAERLFLGRHKFYHFRIWFRDQLSGYVKEVLLDKRSLNRSYLNGKAAEQIVLEHTSGRMNYTTEITKLLTAELMQRLMIDNDNQLAARSS